MALVCPWLLPISCFATNSPWSQGVDALLGGSPTKSISLLRQPDTASRITSKDMTSRYLSLVAAFVLIEQYSNAEPVMQHLLTDDIPLIDNEFKAEQPWTIFEIENLGFLFEMKGRFKEAEALYKRALDLSRRQPATNCQIKYQLAEFYRLRHEEQLARQFQSEAEHDAKRYDVWSGAAKAVAYKEGSNFFQKCFRRGLAAEKAGEGSTAFILYAAAVHDATTHPPKDANSAHLLAVMADSYSRDNRYGAAIETYEKAISILKSLPSPPQRTVEEAKLGLAETLDFAGNTTKAAEVYFSIPGGPKRAASLVRDSADSYKNIVRARGCGSSVELEKAQVLYDRGAGLAQGKRTKVKTKMDY